VLDLVLIPRRRGIARAELSAARARAVAATVELVARVDVGASVRGLDEKVRRVVPGYMTMGANGMGDMHAMELPKNSVSMLGAKGPFGLIDMGGMFTIVKVRDRLDSAADPGWYAHPKGTVASEASADELARDGIKV
jgi:hypothetical protein